jgi:hypothetical protein
VTFTVAFDRGPGEHELVSKVNVKKGSTKHPSSATNEMRAESNARLGVCGLLFTCRSSQPDAATASGTSLRVAGHGAAPGFANSGSPEYP